MTKEARDNLKGPRLTQSIDTIEKTVKAFLCSGCGTCVSLCPTSAISIAIHDGVYKPEINKSKCSNCSTCLEICPGYSIDFDEINSKIFGKVATSILGNYVQCYLGHSTDPRIRYNASSGGLVTQLLLYALEQKIIDGALVTTMKASNPLLPEVYIARNKDEIVAASRSKYCPVSLNTGLKDLIKLPGRFAVVGLPCHIAGIRKAEEINSQLADKIVLHLGLVCNHAPTFMATKYLLETMHVAPHDVKNISYRGEGWPGKFSVTLKNQQKRSVGHFDPNYWGHVFHLYFTTKRCLLCNDKMNEFSDASFCDAWGKASSKYGESIVIARTSVGHELLKKAMDKGLIRIKPITSLEVMESQGLLSVKRQHAARMNVFNALGKDIPFYSQMTLKPNIGDYPFALMGLLRQYISSKPNLWKIIKIYPTIHKVLKG